MTYYSEISASSVCIAELETSGAVTGPSMIPVAGFGQLGKHWTGSVWEEVAQPDPEWKWFIDLGPFYDRFGAQKMAVLASTDATVKAIVADCNIRKWIDLERADVATALAAIGAIIPAVDATLQAAILATPVADHENLALRKLYF